eukprot:536929-Heterocapsa_arctica.AAC.1
MILGDQRAMQKLFTATLNVLKDFYGRRLSGLKTNCSTNEAECEEVKKSRADEMLTPRGKK